MKYRQIFYLLPLLIAVGCGGDAVPVTGTVKLTDGTPLTSGSMIYQSETINVVGNLDAQGRFSLYQQKPGDKVPPGTYRGAISYDTSQDNPVQVEGVSRQSLLPFPAKYESFEQSGLTFVAEPGKPLHLEIVLE